MEEPGKGEGENGGKTGKKPLRKGMKGVFEDKRAHFSWIFKGDLEET